jgi:hypothetical protein
MDLLSTRGYIEPIVLLSYKIDSNVIEDRTGRCNYVGVYELPGKNVFLVHRYRNSFHAQRVCVKGFGLRERAGRDGEIYVRDTGYHLENGRER